MKLKGLKFTPILAVAGAYANGDQLGGINQLENVVDHTGGQTLLKSIVVLDSAKQNGAMDVFFFDELPTLISIDNAPFSISDAELAEKCIGHMEVLAADYHPTATSAVATISDLNLVLQAKAKSKHLFAVLVMRNANTYADGDLTLVLGFEPA